MGSIRDQILGAFVTRLGSIAGWSSQLRGAVNYGDAAVRAVVFFASEDKTIATNETYQATMQVGVLLTVRSEDADAALDDGNPYRYLDRMVVEVERKVHDPDSWGLDPDYTDAVVLGHEVSDPDEQNELQAVVRLQFRYRHDYQDPAT